MSLNSTAQQTLILAAHGAGDESSANQSLRAMADRLRKRPGFDEVIVAFNLGVPSFAEVLSATKARNIVVVPVMTSDGYFRQTFLPRELARNKRYPYVQVTVTSAVGTHQALPGILLARVDSAMRDTQFDVAHAAIVVVGHGSERSPHSADATNTIRDALATQLTAARFESAFLDQTPKLEELVDHLNESLVIVVPFLFGGGFHATRDIPERLRLIDPHIPRRLYHDRLGRRYVIIETLSSGFDLDDIVWSRATNTDIVWSRAANTVTPDCVNLENAKY